MVPWIRPAEFVFCCAATYCDRHRYARVWAVRPWKLRDPPLGAGAFSTVDRWRSGVHGRRFRRRGDGCCGPCGICSVRCDRTATWSSLTSDPHADDGLISVTPKVVPTGTVSQYLVREIAPGDIVRLGEVEGMFTLPDPLPDRLLFISAGSGITPIVSMLRHLDHRNALDDAVVLHSDRTAGQVMFDSTLRELDRHREGIHPQVRLTETDGRTEPADLDVLCPDWPEHEAFLSGPGGDARRAGRALEHPR